MALVSKRVHIHNGNGLLGPNSTVVVNMDPLCLLNAVLCGVVLGFDTGFQAPSLQGCLEFNIGPTRKPFVEHPQCNL